MSRRLHGGAVLLLAGWLLVYPPLASQPDGTVTVDSTAPIAKWTRNKTYDSARECETVSASLARNWEQHDRACETDGTTNRARCHALAVATRQSRCVAAEPVPPPKATRKKR